MITSKSGVLVLGYRADNRFRNHLAKHDKPFKCSISGCLNPGFARKDQVRRHEETVHSKSEEITIKLVSPSSVENDRPQ